MFKKLHILFLLLILTIITPAFAGIFGYKKGDDRSVWDILTREERFTNLVSQIEQNELTDYFKHTKAQTVFAPVNEAFDKEDSSVFKRKYSKEQILYHLVGVSAKSDELWDGRLLDTFAYMDKMQQRLKVSKSTTEIAVGTGSDQAQAKVIDQNIEASNGVIHAVDKVLSLPLYLDETLRMNKDSQDFYDKAKKADITNELRQARGYTVFVTKGDIFGDELSSVEKSYLLDHPEGRKDLSRLLKHAISPDMYSSDKFAEGKSAIDTLEGSEKLEIFTKVRKILGNQFKVNDIDVEKSDILAANGVIHILERPLMPKDKGFIEPATRKTLLGMNKTQIVKLFDENGLGSYLDEDQVYKTTIIAPPNDAFEGEDEDSLTGKRLKSWLQYHIVHGRYEPSDLKDGQLLETESHDNLGQKEYQRLNVRITDNPSLGKDTILFGKSAVVGDPIPVKDNQIIYSVAQPLELPRDPLAQLPVNLDLSTFVASIYASGSDEIIRKSHGITLFAPTNNAFNRLGLLAKHLLQPESQEKLAKVATYHAGRGVYYQDAVSEGEYRIVTLSSNAEITLNKTKDGFFVRGHGAADGDDREVIGKVDKTDILTSNGVIHTIDRVQIPSSVKVTNYDLLTAEGTASLLNLLQHADLKEEILKGLDPNEPYTILAPSNRAFGKINLEDLLENRDKLIKVARLHILPVSMPRLNTDEILQTNPSVNEESPKDVPYIGVDIPTLSDGQYVVIRRGISGGYDVAVKGTLQDRANIVNIGRSSASGGVLVIDNVLLPKEEFYRHSMPWWAILLIVLGVLVGLAILAGAAYSGWRWYKSRREGNIHLGEEN
ncbi:FAS1 domain-containing protein [Gilbertella persicaria]|uniref:FAS1 domain-containing protein n=1 Tax=Gilbertella persicaria TaxID=101096 RepID=UPI00221F9E05|nr:FAS1 domain-containing protein [Gilbertella persicaria]KAI8055588.1 FAS1 domain-containing protein [Gilbertella persicaria]